jgi:hypothetical protein
MVKKAKIEFGSMVRVIKINKSGVVISKKWEKMVSYFSKWDKLITFS